MEGWARPSSLNSMHIYGCCCRESFDSKPSLTSHVFINGSLRDEWLTQLVDELVDNDSYEYLKHLTDVYRLHMFDAIMQYRAIFFDAPATAVRGHATRMSAGYSHTYWLVAQMSMSPTAS